LLKFAEDDMTAVVLIDKRSTLATSDENMVKGNDFSVLWLNQNTACKAVLTDLFRYVGTFNFIHMMLYKLTFY